LLGKRRPGLDRFLVPALSAIESGFRNPSWRPPREWTGKSDGASPSAAIMVAALRSTATQSPHPPPERGRGELPAARGADQHRGRGAARTAAAIPT